MNKASYGVPFFGLDTPFCILIIVCMNNEILPALKEAFANCMVANVFNVPLNWLILATLIPLQWSPLSITIVTTLIFTVVALVRFVCIRLYFERKSTS